jgi:hypothetical protein
MFHRKIRHDFKPTDKLLFSGEFFPDTPGEKKLKTGRTSTIGN